MSQAPSVHMLREEGEDAADPDARTDSDGKRQHEAEFYGDDKVRTVVIDEYACCTRLTLCANV